MNLKSLSTAFALALTSLCVSAQTAPVEIQNAWARATVSGQKATGAFMTLKSPTDTQLVRASTPVGIAQIHAMKMDNNVMQMFELKNGLELPAGKAVELKSGGYHVMLMDLKAPLTKDSQVPLTLVFKNKANVETSVTLNLPVRVNPDQGAAMGHSMPGHMHTKP